MVGGVGSGNGCDYSQYLNAMLLDPTTGDAMSVGADGAPVTVSPDVVAKALEAAGLMIVNGKIVGTVDKLEKSKESANSMLSLGAPPPLPTIGNTAPAGEVASSIKMMQFAESIQESAMLMMALVILLQGAEEDRKTDDQLGNTMFKMKDLAKQGQIGASKAKLKADVATAKENYRNAMIMGAVQIVTAAASAATAGAGTLVTGLVGLVSAGVNAGASIMTAKWAKDSAEKGAQRQSGEQDKNITLFKKMEENAQSVIDMTKESGDACREMWKNALKLISAVAQRSTQNVQAFTRI